MGRCGAGFDSDMPGVPSPPVTQPPAQPPTQPPCSASLPAAGRQYPPPLAHLTRLHQLLLPGRLHVGYTGGGCLVRRLPRCQGRYLLCISQADQERVDELLQRLPALNAEDERQQERVTQPQQKQRRRAGVGAAGELQQPDQEGDDPEAD